MALCASPASPPSASARKLPPSLSYSHQFSAASQPCPVLIIQRQGIHCSPVRVSAFHTCPDTCSPPRTLYHVLQVPQTASHTDIKAAYRRLARLYHPDVHGAIATDEDDEKEARTKLFLQIHSAYATLSDVQARARYDLQLSAQALQGRIVHLSSPQSAGSDSLSARASPAFFQSRVGRSWESDQCWC